MAKGILLPTTETTTSMAGRQKKVTRHTRPNKVRAVMESRGNPDHDVEALGFLDILARFLKWFKDAYDTQDDTVSIGEISKATGIATSTLEHYLTFQDRLPPLPKLDLILRCFGLTVRDLMYDRELIPASLEPKRVKEMKLQALMQDIDARLDGVNRLVQLYIPQPQQDEAVKGIGRILEDIDDICDIYKLERLVRVKPKRKKTHKTQENDLQSQAPGVIVVETEAAETPGPESPE